MPPSLKPFRHSSSPLAAVQAFRIADPFVCYPTSSRRSCMYISVFHVRAITRSEEQKFTLFTGLNLVEGIFTVRERSEQDFSHLSREETYHETHNIDYDTGYPGILRLERHPAGGDTGRGNAYRTIGEWNIQYNLDRRAVHRGHRPSGALHALDVRRSEEPTAEIP